MDYPFGIYAFRLPWSSMDRMLWWETFFMRYCDARYEHCQCVVSAHPQCHLESLEFLQILEIVVSISLKNHQSLLKPRIYFLSSVSFRSFFLLGSSAAVAEIPSRGIISLHTPRQNFKSKHPRQSSTLFSLYRNLNSKMWHLVSIFGLPSYVVKYRSHKSMGMSQYKS